VAITDTLLAAFHHCETKAYLLSQAEADAPLSVNSPEGIAGTLKQQAFSKLKAKAGESECHIGMPPRRILKEGSYRLILEPDIAVRGLRSQPDFLWRHAMSNGVAIYNPVRIVAHEKVTITDRITLAFDSAVISQFTGSAPTIGKIVCGTQLDPITVRFAQNSETMKSTLRRLHRMLAAG
jgi:hypothetical protein